MTAPPVPNLDLLLAQSDWVRALARRLVFDTHSADDVVQSTWLAFLRRPLRQGESVEAMRAWLATTLRRNAVRHRVETVRRGDREMAAAHDEGLPSTVEVLEQESVRRALVEAVLALEEPYRSTLILRYFDGLGPMDIAQRLGVSGSTVRSRLQRGLALLRERFERERGAGWKSWCVIILPMAKTAAVGSGITGGVLVGTKMKLAGIVVLVLGASVVAWKALEFTPSRGMPLASDSKTAQLETPLPDPSPPLVKNAQGATNTRALAIPESTSTPDGKARYPEPEDTDPVGILVYGSIVDENGDVPNARKDRYPGAVSMSVRFTEDHGDDVWAIANAKGLYSLAGLHSGQWRVTTWAQGFQCVPMEITLDAAVPIRRLDLVLRHATLVRIRILTPDGTPLKQALKAAGGLSDMFGVIAVASKIPPGPRLPETLERNHSHFGSSTYWGWGSSVSPAPLVIPESDAGVIEVKDGLPAYISLAWREIVLDTQLAPLGTQELTFTLSTEKVLGCIGRARVRIVDALTDEPLQARARLEERDTVNSDTLADKSGVIEFGNILPGLLLLSINCKDHESIIERVHIEPGILTDLGTYRLQPGVSIEGRVVDENGQPIAGAIAALEMDQAIETRNWFRYSTKPGGEFRLPQMRHARFWMWAGSGDSESLLVSPAVIVDARGGDVRGLVFQLSKPIRVFVRVKPEVPWNAEVRLVRSDGAPQFVGELRDEGAMNNRAWLYALPGEYELQLVSQDTVIRSRPLRVTGSNVEVDL